MKITVIGAGAMGCLYAAMLCEEHDVALVDAYSPVVEAINANGVTVKERDGSQRTCKIPAFQSGKVCGPAQLVIVFVKDTATDAALAQNRGLIGEDTYVLSLQNGLGNDSVIQNYVNQNKILIGTSKHNSVTLSPGCIYHSGSGSTFIGSLCGDISTADKIAAELAKSVPDTKSHSDAKRVMWQKLFVNMTVNPITALMNTKIGFVSENEYARKVAEELLKEAVKVAEKDGEAFEYDKVLSDVLGVVSADGTGFASMCQDIRGGRKTEIDYINGAVSRLGKKYGVSTPYHDMITALIHAKENI